MALALVIAGCGEGSDGLASMDDDAFIRHLDRRIPALMEAHAIPGAAILVIRDGRPAGSRAYGWSDAERRRALTTKTVMMTHSISKPVTAWGVMRLVEEGRIGLDDPVGRHLPEWRLSSGDVPEGVTVRALLSQSSGLPLGPIGTHYPPGAAIPPLHETLSAPEVRLIREPGVAFEYSNLGFGVLEWLIQEVTGRDFGEYMEERVLKPLGMHDSTFDWSEARHRDIPMGHDLRGNTVPTYVYPYRASGGLFSTVEDIGRFVVAGMSAPGGSANPVLSAATVNAMYAPAIPLSGVYAFVSDDYGLGHFLETLSGGETAVWHGGQGHGWMTHFHSVPETGDGLVILTNSQRSWPFFALVLQEWTRWRGLGPVGMSRIATLGTAMNGVVAALTLGAIWKAWTVGSGITNGRRRLVLGTRPVERRRAVGRMADLALGVLLSALLLWAVSQEYLFVSSVFPASAGWLGWSLLALAAASLASALFPVPASPARR